jgi:phosphoribulokinase
MHLKLIRDQDSKPVDALHVHGYASRDTTRQIEESIWSELGVDAELPQALGVVGNGTRSEPLAVVQLILLYHLLMASRSNATDESAVNAG